MTWLHLLSGALALLLVIYLFAALLRPEDFL